MNERVDTRSGVMPGKYRFTVSAVPEKGSWGNANYYEFKFLVGIGGDRQLYSERVPVWKCADLLRALGAREVEAGVFDWDKEAVVGIMFDGEIVMEKNPKDNKEYRRLSNPVALPNFPKDPSVGAGGSEEVPF